MTRRRRGETLIETWEHFRYKVQVPIYLSKEDGVFHAQYAEEPLSSKELEELRLKLSKLVEESMVLDWIPIIEITADGSVNASRWVPTGAGGSTEEEVEYDDQRRETGQANMSLTFKRYWIAKRPDGKWIECSIWHSQDKDGKSDHYTPGRTIHEPMPRRLNSSEFYIANRNKDFKIPFVEKSRYSHESDTNYVAYTEELWNGINQIANKLNLLKEKLKEMLGSVEGRAMLLANVSKLLPAPQPEPKRRKS